MPKLTRRKFVPVALALLAASVTECTTRRRGVAVHRTRYGTYTTVRRPIIVVDPWTGRALRRRRYRRYRIRRHDSPEVVYTATHDNSTLEVKLTPIGDDETQIEVTARNGDDDWDPGEARMLLDYILENDN